MNELFGDKLFKQIEKLIQQVAGIVENHEQRITNLEIRNRAGIGGDSGNDADYQEGDKK